MPRQNSRRGTKQNTTFSLKVALSWLIFVASSFRRLLTLVKSPADFASMSSGKVRKDARLGWITASMGILTVFASVFRWRHEDIQPEEKVPGSIWVIGVAVGGAIFLYPRFGEVILNEGELALLLGVTHNGVCHRARTAGRQQSGRAETFFLRRTTFLCKPRENVHIPHLQQDLCNPFQMRLEQLSRQKRRDFPRFQRANEVFAGIRKADQPVPLQEAGT